MEVGHMMCYNLGRTSYKKVLFQDKAVETFLDIGAFCSCASTNFLDIIYPEWRQKLRPVPKAMFMQL